jgi:arylsulfatase A-like enzyme
MPPSRSQRTRVELVHDVGVFRTSVAIDLWRSLDQLASNALGREGVLRLAGVRRHLQGVVGNTARDRIVTEEFLAWLGRRPAGRPFFAYLHYMSPHLPYDPPTDARRRVGAPEGLVFAAEPPKAWCYRRADAIPPAELRDRLALYDAGIVAVDVLLGRVLGGLDGLGLAESTLVVVTADHGEEFFEHGSWAHGQSLYDELIHVPLIMRLPGELPSGRRVAGLVMGVDVMPTIVAAAGAAPPPEIVGHDLGPMMRAEETEADSFAYAELVNEECESRALMRQHAKLIEWKDTTNVTAAMVFHLGHDPGEQQPLPSDAQDFETLTRTLSAERERSTRFRASPETVSIDAEQREKLKALGYLR